VRSDKQLGHGRTSLIGVAHPLEIVPIAVLPGCSAGDLALVEATAEIGDVVAGDVNVLLDAVDEVCCSGGLAVFAKRCAYVYVRV
jgi:hypothetical protein